MPTADTHHRCGEVHFCFRRVVGRRDVMRSIFRERKRGIVSPCYCLVLFLCYCFFLRLRGRNSFWIHTAIPPPRATFPPDFEV